MADEKKQFEEEEYQFGETTESTQYSSETARLPSPEANNIRRFVLLGIGLLIVIFAVYKMLGVFFGSAAKKPSQTMSQPMNQPMQQPDTMQKPVVMEQPLAIPQPAPSSPAMETRFSALESSTQSVKNDVAQITANMGQVNQSILAINEKLIALTEKMEKISAEMTAQQTAKMKTKMKRHLSRPRANGMSQQSSQFYLQAVVPGRAWIMTGSGKPITVREGSTLPGLGRVRTIDANQGIVIMSNGRIIRFNPDES